MGAGPAGQQGRRRPSRRRWRPSTVRTSRWVASCEQLELACGSVMAHQPTMCRRPWSAGQGVQLTVACERLFDDTARRHQTRGRTWPISSSSGAPGSTTSRTSRSTCPATPSSCSPGCPARASRAWPSTRSSPRASAATSSRSRRTPASSSARWTSPTSTSSRACRPAVSIDQKSTSKNPRSTVGTITEVYDYLRLLYARAGRPHCPTCGAPIERQTPAADRRPGAGPRGGHPVPGARAGDPRPQGRVRRAVPPAADPGLLPGPGQRRDPHRSTTRRSSTSRRSTPSRWSSTGSRSRRPPSAGSPTRSRPRSTSPAGWCSSTSSTSTPRTPAASCGSPRRWPAPTTTPSTPTSSSRARSRSTRPFGACPECHGLGTRMEVDPELVVPDPQATLGEGAIQPWSQAHVADYFLRLMGALGDELGFDLEHPVGGPPRQGAAVAPRRPPDQGPRRHPQPLRPRARLLRRVRGRARPTSSAGTARPSPTPAASGSRASCARCRAPPARAAGSSRCRWRSPWASARRQEHRRGLRAADQRDRRLPPRPRPVARASSRSASGCSRRSRSGSTSCSTSASTTSPSTGRPARCPAARRSGSGWRPRSAPAWSASSTSSTSPPSACTSATTTG